MGLFAFVLLGAFAMRNAECFYPRALVPYSKISGSTDLQRPKNVQIKRVSRTAPARRVFMSEGDVDWRSFRAKLVSQELKENKSGDHYETTNEPSAKAEEWVYDAGKFVETGSVILGGSQMEYGFGLRQQYFHKSVMLVLSHDDRFTKGIIVNRPTSKELDGWRIW